VVQDDDLGDEGLGLLGGIVLAVAANVATADVLSVEYIDSMLTCGGHIHVSVVAGEPLLASCCHEGWMVVFVEEIRRVTSQLTSTLAATGLLASPIHPGVVVIDVDVVRTKSNKSKKESKISSAF
jgi:hypothetical protein